MTREGSKYCEKCQYCKNIQCTHSYEKDSYKVSCQIGAEIHYEAIVYCKYKKIKKEKRKC